MSKKITTALFDMDGVIFDTEPQYTIFWDKMGWDYLGIEDFARNWKGIPIKEMLKLAFGHLGEATTTYILEQSIAFEANMLFEYIPGAKEFILGLKERGIDVAVVTSSLDSKMQGVYRSHPDFKGMFTQIVTCDNIKKGKPDPECFLMAMDHLGAKAENTIIFEDSVLGLQAAVASEGIVVGLSTTCPIETIQQYSSHIIPDFNGIDIDKFLESLSV